MSKAGEKTGSGSASATGGEPPQAESSSAGGTAGDDGFALHEHIGRQLKLLFEEVAGEPVPERLRRLLEKLEREPPREDKPTDPPEE